MFVRFVALARTIDRYGMNTPGAEPLIDAATFDCDLMIVGLARNCSGTIESAIAGLQASVPPFRRVHWYVVESDSDDGTVEVLERLKSTVENFDFVSLGRLRDAMPKRTERIAHCRNAYLDVIRSRLGSAGLSYVLVADLDGVNPLLKQAAILSCWARADWDVCTANQAGPYYDIWALRHPEWCPNDCWKAREFLTRFGRSPRGAALAAVYSRMITIPTSSDWIEVESAFGGLALYRADTLANVRYVGLDDNGEEVCEHVELHRQIRAAGKRIFINPAMINATITEHSRYWVERASVAAETKRFLFRLAVRALYGKTTRQGLRNMIESAS